jgi:hypothetical protein
MEAICQSIFFGFVHEKWVDLSIAMLVLPGWVTPGAADVGHVWGL